MTTALDLITDVFYKLKVYSPGQQIQSADSAWGLTSLNDMLDSWSNESLACFANVEQSFVMVPGQNAYTIGTGGQINLTRPISIRTGAGAAYLVDTNSNRYPINVVEQNQWNQIGLLIQQSQLPDTLFYDPQYPLGIINIFPQPSIAYTVYFDSRLQLVYMSNLFQVFSLPPGYMAAIKDGLYLRMYNDYFKGDPPAWRVEMASKSLSAIKRSNIKISPSTYDGAIVSKARGAYNVYSDDSSGSRGRG